MTDNWYQRPTASHRILAAKRVRAEVATHPDKSGKADALAEATDLEAKSREKLPADAFAPGAGGELVPEPSEYGLAPALRDTLARPDYVAADASRMRAELGHRGGCLEMALDAADTMQAGNSVEKMLAHQLAAAHNVVMRMAGRAARHSERVLEGTGPSDGRDFHAVEAARAANAVSRLMDSFQRGVVTLQRLKMGGRQVVTVQHVQVNEGGQAVVAGRLAGGGANRRRQKRTTTDDE